MFVLLLILQSLSYASQESNQFLGTATGVADSTFLGSNPTGWGYNASSKLILGAGTLIATPSQFNLSGGVAFGKSNVGGGAIATYTAGALASVNATAGIGALLKGFGLGLNLGIGITPTFSLNSVTPGFILNPTGPVRIGAMYTVGGNLSAGLSGKLGQALTLAGDVSTSPTTSFSTIALTPGAKLSFSKLSLAGYYTLTYNRTFGSSLTGGPFGLAVSSMLGYSSYVSVSTLGFTTVNLLFALRM